jgi:hypothetical protein
MQVDKSRRQHQAGQIGNLGPRRGQLSADGFDAATGYQYVPTGGAAWTQHASATQKHQSGHADYDTAVTMNEQTIHLSGHVAAEQARRDPYIYLPFSVPPGTRRIDVAYRYSDPVTAPFGMGPGNTVDIGIFDSRGHAFLEGQGFRGWSGSDRPGFFVAEEDATPGYIPGALFPGEWNVMLGLARLEPSGAGYDVTVTLTGRAPVAHGSRPGPASGAQQTATVARAAVARTGEGRWLKGDLHCHTVHSDGLNTVRQIVEHAVSLGLDFLAITDHNTNTHHREMDALKDLPIVLVPGEEVTTYWGHANTWGLREWIEYRCAGEESIASVRDFLRRRDALFSINHAKCVGPPWLFRGWEGFDCMEVWQAPWRFFNWESLEKWDGLLAAGNRVVAVGGSDVHSIPPAEPRHPHGLAEPTTWVYVSEPTEGGVLEAIRAGRTFVTDAPRSPRRLLLFADEDGDGAFEKMMGDEVDDGPVCFRVDITAGRDCRLWIVSDGEPIDIVPVSDDDARIEFTLDMTGRKYVRAELRGYRGRPERGEVVWAITSPIWGKR